MTLQIPSRYRLLIGLGLLLSTLLCLPGYAGDQSLNQEPSTTVKFGDLDLNTDAGRRELLDGLSKAAGRVCSASVFRHRVPYHAFYRSCYSRTLATAVDKVHHEQLSALFAALSRPNTR